jgi:hypothetical protein
MGTLPRHARSPEFALWDCTRRCVRLQATDRAGDTADPDYRRGLDRIDDAIACELRFVVIAVTRPASMEAGRMAGLQSMSSHEFNAGGALGRYAPVRVSATPEFQDQCCVGWDMRVQFLIAAAAIAGGTLGVAPAVIVSGSTTVLAGCGHGYYQNSDGQCIPDPSAGGVGGAPGGGLGIIGGPGGPPPGATAICRDGDYSYSTHHSGTCSGHGGVKQWLSN